MERNVKQSNKSLSFQKELIEQLANKIPPPRNENHPPSKKIHLIANKFTIEETNEKENTTATQPPTELVGNLLPGFEKDGILRKLDEFSPLMEPP